MAFSAIAAATLATAPWPPPGYTPPRLLFGPTANQKNVTTSVLDMLSGPESAWSTVLSKMKGSKGALHVRPLFHNNTDHPDLWGEVAAQLDRLGLELSIETAESGFCGVGSGARAATLSQRSVQGFLDAGGKIRYWNPTSIFSRTHSYCPEQDINITISECAEYASIVQTKFPDVQMYLYDALPHYSVGKEWPANVPAFELDLGDILTRLRAAWAAKNVTLRGYWADCPEEYSEGYPNGDGYERLAAAVKLVKGMGLEFGKTFNYGAKSATDKSWHDKTIADFVNMTRTVPSASSGNHSMDIVMIETWYAVPKVFVPETQPYSLTYTARDMFSRVRTE